MREWILMQKCAAVNFREWSVTPQIWISLAVTGGMVFWNLSWVLEYSRACGIRLAPWILPHFFTMPVMLAFFAALTTMFFSSAPFRDQFTQFLEIRVGRRLWIRAQVLYILEASAVYTAFYALATVLACLPRIYPTWEWGTLITQMALVPGDVAEYGIQMESILFSGTLINDYSAPEAMVWSCLMIWLVSAFLGMLIFGVNILAGQGRGIMAAGFFAFLSSFSHHVGWLIFGNRIYYFSPVNWINLNFADGRGRPDLIYAVVFLTLQIAFWAVLGVRVYQIKEKG